MSKSTDWHSYYSAPDPGLWVGRYELPTDSCFYQHIRLLDLRKDQIEKTSPLTFALLGFKCDEGALREGRRTGAFEGPPIIRQRLCNLPIQKQTIHCYDIGDIVCLDHQLEASQEALTAIVSLLLEKQICPILLGGGRELAWGHYVGIKNVLPKERRLGIINFDAHFDMRPLSMHELGSAQTTFHQIALDHQASQRHFDYNCIGIQHVANIRQAFEIAKEFNTKVILADEVHQGLQEKCFDFVDRIIDENDYIYSTLSLDVFSAAFAPGVSSIQPLGLNPWHVIPLLRQVAASGKVVGYDMSEFVPRYDINHRTAKLAAVLVYEIMHHHLEAHKHR